MAKHLLIIFTLTFSLLFAISGRAQSWEWAQQATGTNNISANSIDVDKNGNSYVTGKFYDVVSFGATTISNPGRWSVYIVKYDVNGNVMWAKLAGSANDINPTGICVDKSGNLSITGNYLGNGVFGNSNSVALTPAGSYDVFVAEFTNEGEFLWAKSAGDIGFDYGSSISTDSKNNLYITGDFHLSSFNGSASKIFIAKYDSSGNCSWIKMPQVYSNFHLGDGIITDSSGNSYITGVFFDSLSFDSAHILIAGNVESNVFIAKFNTDGATLWLQKAGAGSGYAGGNAIALDASGNSYVTGFYRGTISFGAFSISNSLAGFAYQTFIAKCNSNGDYVWVINGTGFSNGVSICTDKNGDPYVMGYFNDAVNFESLTLTNSGGVDLFVVKADASGNFIWATQCGGQSDDNVGGIKANSQGIFLAGSFSGTINFGPTISLNDNSGVYDAFIAKMNSTTGIDDDENSLSGIHLFPNPVMDEFQLGGIHTEIEFIIYNASGKLMMEGRATSANHISIANLNAGIYFIELFASYDPNKSKSIRFIKG